MSRWHSYLNSAKEILQLYWGTEPFASFIKSYFAAHKKFGSGDRKQVSHLCYCYFRLGKAMPAIAVEERILVALFICSEESNELLEQLKPEWNERVALTSADKLSYLKYPGSIKDIFPWIDELSNEINPELFILSHIRQPDLFIRLRPGKENLVKQKLQQAGISFNIISDGCLALPNASKIDGIVEPDKEVVVQDYSSQRVGELIQLAGFTATEPIKVWDSCAGSGGKSILVNDILGKIDLTVSDVRESILKNLEKRFAKAGIMKYKSFVVDLTQPVLNLKPDVFNLIVADVPCSGSGTWSRTPEQLYFFDEKKIDEYAALQRKIVSNIITHLEPGGYLLYITCSVFKKENEEVVDFIKERFHLQPVKMELIKGYDKKADTMFAGLLKKSL